MKHQLKVFITSLMFVAVATTARAGILEIRGGVGMAAADPHSLEDKANAAAAGGLDAGDFQTFNADIFFDLPVIPIGVGVRQEWLNSDSSGPNGSKLDLKAQNLSLLVDWRIIDTLFYVGPIVGIGHPSAKIDYNTGTASISDKIKSDELSYSAGVEAGVKFSKFLIGAETGYQSVKLKAPDNSSIKAKVDLSGFYGKVMVGLTFL